MSTCKLAIVLILASVVGAVAQPSSSTKLWKQHPRLALFGDADVALSTAQFGGLPTVPSCCPEYTGATDIGFVAGLAYISPLDDLMSVHIRMHYSTYGSPLTSTQTLPIDPIDNGPSTATIEHSLTGTFQQISVEPLFGYEIANGLNALGGLTLGAAFSATYDQKETLMDPPDATFQNRSRVRNALSGDIQNANVFQAGITVGLSYDLPLTSDGSVLISPEVLFTYSLLPHTSDVSWNTHHLRAGLAVGFVPVPETDSLTDVELYEFTKGIKAPTTVAPGIPFVARISHSGITETGSNADGSSIRIEEFTSNRIRPLLPYVFFTPGSSDLQSKYRRLTAEQVESFSMKNFYNLDAIVTYHHLLNIVGKRLQENPSATITLTGCADPAEATQTTASARANVVRDYLVDTWNIEPSRITVNSQGLPERASRSNEADGVAENARVEINASTPEILAPVESTDTMLVTTPSGIRFAPSIDPRVHIAGYTLFIAQNGTLLKTIDGPDPLPSALDWRVSESAPWISKDQKEISYLIAVRDSSGAVIPSATHTIPIERVGSTGENKTGKSKTRLDRYSLILFGFDQDALSAEHQGQIAMFKQRIQPSSTVKVVGYTDRTGDASYNQSLSERRARNVAAALGVPESSAMGRGEVLPLYDNSTPEGRFYSRTVEVLVETPQP